MIHGSCMCGGIKFEITGEPYSLSYCHCSRCRKSSGIFSAVLVGKSDDLKITQGEDLIQRINPGPDWKIKRCFCRTCGTPLGDMHNGKIYVVAASALDDEPLIAPSFHMHTSSKPNWYDINDGLKQFEGDYVPDS